MASQQRRDEWARNDAKTSNDFGRTGAQAAILVNGGAVVAVLAFVGSVADGDNVKAFIPTPKFSLGTYAFGVFLAAISMLIMSIAIESYMASWLAAEDSRESQASGKRGKLLGASGGVRERGGIGFWRRLSRRGGSRRYGLVAGGSRKRRSVDAVLGRSLATVGPGSSAGRSPTRKGASPGLGGGLARPG